MKINKPATVVIAAKAGRLGNRLFLSAYFMANARALGYSLLNPALGEYAPFFEGSVHDPLCRFPGKINPWEPEFAAQCREVALHLFSVIGLAASAVSTPGIQQIDIRDSHDENDLVYDLLDECYAEALQKNRLLIVKGWKFRDDRNLVRFHAEISRYFKPVSSIRQPVEEVLKKACQTGDYTVGVHIRQGDYRNWKNGVHYFETEQYAHWMKELSALLPQKKISFILCASDPVDRAAFQGLSTVDGPGGVVADLYALSQCDAIMGPPSTFSTWASYYGRVPLCMLQHAGQNIALHDFVLHDRV